MDGVLERIDEDEDVEASDDGGENITTPVHNAGHIEGRITEEQEESKQPLAEPQKVGKDWQPTQHPRYAPAQEEDEEQAQPTYGAGPY